MRLPAAVVLCVLAVALCNVATAAYTPERRRPVPDDGPAAGCPVVAQCDIIDLYYAGSLSRMFYYRHLAAASAPGSTVPSCAGGFHAFLALIDEWAPIVAMLVLLIPVYAALHISWSWINRLADDWYTPYSDVKILAFITLGVRMLWRLIGLVTFNHVGNGESNRPKKKKTM